MLAKISLSRDMCPKTEDEKRETEGKPYRELVGSLLYLTTCTRPDLASAVFKLSQYLHNPGLAHWDATHHLLRYIKGTVGWDISYQVFVGSAPGYCDSDYAGDFDFISLDHWLRLPQCRRCSVPEVEETTHYRNQLHRSGIHRRTTHRV